MAADESETLADIHFWQAEGDVPAHHRMLEKYGAIFGQNSGEGEIYRMPRSGCEIYDRRDRQLRFRDRHEFHIGQGQRVSYNRQKIIHAHV